MYGSTVRLRIVLFCKRKPESTKENQSTQSPVTSITRQIIINIRFVSHLFQQDSPKSALFDDFKMLFLEWKIVKNIKLFS